MEATLPLNVLNLQQFAEDGILGKKLYITIVNEDGSPVMLKGPDGSDISKSPEMLKWGVEGIDQEQKKHPIGEEDEYRTVQYVGFQGSFEGEDTNSWYSDIQDAMYEYQVKTGGTLKFIINTVKIYPSGMVRRHKYSGVTFSKFKENSDTGGKALTTSFSWHARKRERIS